MRLLLSLFLALELCASEYGAFDASAFEKKRFEYDGYLRSDTTLQWPDSGPRLLRSSNELNLRADADTAPLNLHADASFFYKDASNAPHDDNAVLNALYQRFGDEKQSLSLGKEVLRWGKGYAYSGVAFFERQKDLLYPELSREGFVMGHAQFTRTRSEGVLKNYTLDLLLLPASEENNALFTQTDSQGGAKLYMLLDRTDIDIMLARQSVGADFSSDLGGGVELHGEYGIKKGRRSYLAGLRYQSPTDLTVIAEYFKTYEHARYSYLKVSQKEPFSWVYSNLYMLYIDRKETQEYRLLAGGTYDFKNGFTLDLAYTKNDLSQGIKALFYLYF